MKEIALRTKLIFWLLLGFLSVAIAEVSVASAPLAFVNPVETVFLTLFYGGHLLLFAWLAFRRGWPSLTTLWLGGVLFGLYEFYITKVLWAPPWGDTISMANVDVLALIVLAFFWHPFMAFIFPLAVAETVGTRSRWTVEHLPAWLLGMSSRSKRLLLIIAALTHGLVTGNPGMALVSTASAIAAVALVSWWWRRGGRSGNWSLRELLPTDRQGKGVALLVALFYVAFIPLWDPSLMPALPGHVVVWLLYGGFYLLFRGARATANPQAPEPVEGHPTPPRRRVIQWVGALLLLSVLGSLGRPEIGFLAVWGVGTIAGIRMLTGTLRSALRRAPLAESSSSAVTPTEHVGSDG